MCIQSFGVNLNFPQGIFYDVVAFAYSFVMEAKAVSK
jgi:hypothetical protein